MKRIVTMLLALILVLSLIPVSAQATEATVGMRKLKSGESYTTMESSQMAIDIIKDFEGYSATPYADKKQWSVGYGSYCGSINKPKPNIYLTRDEAEARLRSDLKKTYEVVVNNYCKSIGRQPSQQQFDALVDLTYNVGGSWTTGTVVTSMLKNPTDEITVARAFGAYCRSGGSISYTHMHRRLREAMMFLYGEYYLAYGNQDCRSNLKVIHNDNLPHFKAVVFKTNSGNFSNGRGEISNYYFKDEYYGSFPTPTRSGYTCVGWEITKRNNRSVSGGEEATIYTKATQNLELTAIWKKGTFDVPAPEKPKELGETPFLDVETSDWFYEAVKYVYDNKIMNGTSSVSFDPNGEMTRGMLVTVLYRMDGTPKVTDEQRKCFTDIAGQYYTDAIAWAYANGIANGVTATTFEPNTVVSRQDAVALFYRFCVNYRKLTTEVTQSLESFLDSGDVADYAAEPFAWSVSVGLINGMQGNGGMCLRPEASLDRAQSATILQRCIETILK